MKTTFSAAALCAAVTACLAWSSPPAFAKNAKECATEWNTIKGTPQASGKTRKAFIADCRGLPDADKPLAQGQFKTEAEAKTSCPNDSVVWVNLRSKVFHDSTSKSYGKSKSGAYMCEKDTAAAGFKAPKGSKKPV